MLLEVSLVGVKHAIEPRQELVRAVVGVQDDGAIYQLSFFTYPGATPASFLTIWGLKG